MTQPTTPPRDVLDCYLAGLRDFQFLGNRGGFSGARLWRCTSAAGDFCLKAWPAATASREHLVWVHHLLQGARMPHIDFLPHVIADASGETVVEHAGFLWDLTTWQPGDADFHQRPSPERMAAVGRALAQLHRAWQGAAPSHGPCPGVQRRLDALKSWQALAAQGWRPRFTDDDPVRPWAERALALLRVTALEAQRRLHPCGDLSLPLHPCWCDPWHDHWLFTGDRVTGLIDYGSVKVDHAAVDLARLLGSLAGDDPDLWRIGLEAYQKVRPLSTQEQALVPVLDRTGIVVAAANWLRWLYVEGRAYENRAAVAQRLRDIVARLEYHQRVA